MTHDFAIKSLKYNFLPEDLFKVENEEILKTKIFNNVIKNPIGLAAGLTALKFTTLYLNLDLDLLKLEQLHQKNNLEILNQEFLGLKMIKRS